VAKPSPRFSSFGHLLPFPSPRFAPPHSGTGEIEPPVKISMQLSSFPFMEGRLQECPPRIFQFGAPPKTTPIFYESDGSYFSPEGPRGQGPSYCLLDLNVAPFLQHFHSSYFRHVDAFSEQKRQKAFFCDFSAIFYSGLSLLSKVVLSQGQNPETVSRAQREGTAPPFQFSPPLPFSRLAPQIRLSGKKESSAPPGELRVWDSPTPRSHFRNPEGSPGTRGHPPPFLPQSCVFPTPLFLSYIAGDHPPTHDQTWR